MSIRKLSPCSAYNTQMLEAWLDSMASEGLLLEHEGFRNTYAKFDKTDKTKAFHRIWAQDSLNDYHDAKELRESYGWEYVCSSSGFDIYRAFEESALRIDEDKKNNLYNKKSASKRTVFKIIALIFSLALTAIILYIFPFIIVSSTKGFAFGFEIIILLGYDIIEKIRSIMMLRRIGKGKIIRSDREYDFKKPRILHMIPLAVLIIMFLAVIVLENTDIPIKASLPSDRSQIPFATVIDFTDDKSSYVEGKSIMNNYEKWQTPVAKVNYEWNETAEIKADDGSVIKYNIGVDYHETKHPLIAKSVAKLYVRDARLTPYGFGSFGESPSFGFDYEIMYEADAGGRNYVFCDGNKVIHFHIGCLSETPENFNIEEFDDKCVSVMAQSFME